MAQLLTYAVALLGSNVAYAIVYIGMARALRGRRGWGLAIFLGAFLPLFSVSVVVGASGLKSAWALTLAGVIPFLIWIVGAALTNRPPARATPLEVDIRRALTSAALSVVVLYLAYSLWHSPGRDLAGSELIRRVVAGLMLVLGVIMAAMSAWALRIQFHRRNGRAH
jgi:hypothetical protein